MRTVGLLGGLAWFPATRLHAERAVEWMLAPPAGR